MLQKPRSFLRQPTGPAGGDRRRRPRAAACAALVISLVTACTSEPTYPPPTADEARAAYVGAIRADWVESPPPQPPQGPTAIVPGDTPGSAGRKAATVLDYESDMNSRAIARGQLQSFAKLVLGECEWTGIDPSDVDLPARDRVEGIADDGYLCGYEVFHDTASRGRVSAKGSGYFFHHEGSYDFARIEEANFEPVGQ